MWKRRPILTHNSLALSVSLLCSCFSRGRVWECKTVGRFWMSLMTHLPLRLTILSCEHLCSAYRSVYSQAPDKSWWQYLTAQEDRRTLKEGPGIAPACEYGIVLIVVVGGTHFHTSHRGYASHLMICFCVPKIKTAYNLREQISKDIVSLVETVKNPLRNVFPLCQDSFVICERLSELTLTIMLLFTFFNCHTIVSSLHF